MYSNKINVAFIAQGASVVMTIYLVIQYIAMANLGLKKHLFLIHWLVQVKYINLS